MTTTTEELTPRQEKELDRDLTRRTYNTRRGVIVFEELQHVRDEDYFGIITLNGEPVGNVRRGTAPYRWTATLGTGENARTVGRFMGRGAVDRAVINILRRGR
jgi:hypothetical protein